MRIYVVIRHGHAVIAFTSWSEASGWIHKNHVGSLLHTIDIISLR